RPHACFGRRPGSSGCPPRALSGPRPRVGRTGGDSGTAVGARARAAFMTRPLLTVVGATATGKSDLGIALARDGGEIINGDALQLYRGMDIGTAKLSIDERAGIPHHLVDVLDIGQSASAAEFQVLARRAIEDIDARGLQPVIVGGSGLYVRAVTDGMRFPGTDPAVRARLE